MGALMATGQLKEAIRLARRAQQVEPLSLGISTDLQILLYVDKQYEAALAEVERSMGLAGNHQRANFRKLLLLLLRKDASPQAVQAQFRAVFDDQNVTAPFLRDLAGTIGDRTTSQAVLKRAFADPANHDFARTMVIFQLADALGDRELALAANRRIIRDFNNTPTVWMGAHSGMRSEPGFKELLRELGQVDYFRASGNWGDYCKPLGEDDFECR